MKTCGLAILLFSSTVLARGVTLEHLAQHTNSSDVRAIALTPTRVWAATEGGLAVHARRDGRFLFKLTSADGLPGNSLRVVHPLGGDRLLVGGDFGVAVLRHVEKGSPGAGLRVLPIRDLIRPDQYSPVSALLEDNRVTQDGGPVLVLAQRGLVRLEDDDRGGVTAVEVEAQGGWWQAAAVGGGRLVLGDPTGRLLLLSLDRRERKEMFLDGAIVSLAGTPEDLFVATGEALYRIDRNGLQPLVARDGNSAEIPVAATALALDRRGLLLAGTSDGSLYELEQGSLRRVAVETGGGRITALRPDGHRLWIGREGKGLHLLDGRRGKVPRGLRPGGEICANHITKLTRHRGWLVAGSFDRGACVLTRRGWRDLSGLPSPMVLGLASDGHHLYVATSGGVSRFGPRLEPRPIGQRDAGLLRWFVEEGATAATRIGDRRVALSSKYGLVRIWRKKNGRTRVRYTNHADGVPFKQTDLATADGQLFVASESEGVKRMPFGGEEAWHLQDPHELPENWVTSIAPVAADEIWVATCQSGAVHIRGDRVRTLGVAQGLPDKRMTTVVADREGAFLGTLGGLAWAGSRDDEVVTFGIDAGVPDPRAASLLLDGSRLWVGTEAGLAAFRVRRRSQRIAER